jgi:hypothetical protein
MVAPHAHLERRAQQIDVSNQQTAATFNQIDREEVGAARHPRQ